MKVFPIILIFLYSLIGYSQSSITDQYISQYKDIAIQEMHRTGIPASITLSQGLLESNWGRSELAVKSNNHFGIKCSGGWEGKDHYRYDDEYDKLGRKKKSCFRAYEHAEASFIDHSEFLTDPKKVKRYGFLFEYSPSDYESWAHGLKKAGYATDPKYANKLIHIIEKYSLHTYDLTEEEPVQILAVQNVPTDNNTYRIDFVNSCKVIVAKGGENLKNLSDEVGVSSRKLLKYNEHIQKRNDPIKRGSYVFLEAKPNYYLGDEAFHDVEKGQDLASIANNYGISIEYLESINSLNATEELNPGYTIKLKRAGKKATKKASREIKPERDIALDNSPYLFERALTPSEN